MTIAETSRMEQSKEQPIVYTRRFRQKALARAKEYKDAMTELAEKAERQAALEVVRR